MEAPAELDRLLAKYQEKIDAAVPAGIPWEIVGRILRYRGESGWEALFEEAARRYMSTPAKWSLPAANLRRIIGDTDGAAELWRVGLEDSRQQRNRQAEALICAYFLNDDDALQAELAKATKSIREYWPFDELRTAYLAVDVDGLRHELARWERKAKRAPIASSGEAPSRHDMVEHIQQLIEEIEDL